MKSLRAVASALVLCALASAGIAAAQTGDEKPKKRSSKETPKDLSAPTATALAGAVKPSALMLAPLKARGIGPAIMGGRVSDIALDPSDPDTFYVALGTGGVMKTSNRGGSFDAIFEKEKVASVGAIAVAPSRPGVVWVGSGEANDRNSSAWGNGVYRSTDEGETWKHLGLADTRAIARIVVHPTNPDVAWVAAAGDLWTASSERGLFKTSDGGKTWKKVLAAAAPHDRDAGCGDVVIDASNPDVLYATLYARRRTPWSFTYGTSLTNGKDVGGVFKSTDGGATWTKLGGGLPAATGRIGLDVARSAPNVVYAMVQSDDGGTSDIDQIKSKKGGVFRSEDGGATWKRMSALNPRAFYFSQIRVDPLNDRRIYVLGYMLHASDDGGATWREDLFEKVHADCHALVITGGAKAVHPEPKDSPEAAGAEKEKPKAPISKRLLLGTDGGIYQSLEAGKNWAHLDRFAGGQFYRIQVDMSQPYRICGGLQDNLNWVGPSRTQSKDGILNSDWIDIAGGDGFYCVFDSLDRNVVYAESQGGSLHRFDLASGEVKELRPNPTEGQPTFRYHWNSPLIGSVHEKGALYLAGNRVFKLRSKAEEWQPISGDLSTKDPEKTTATGSGAENYGVVYTLAESPAARGVLWAGTDDGKLWLTEDDGGKWTDVTTSLPAPAKGQWISRVEAGSKDAKVAYLAVDAHRTGNLAPLAYRTADGGRTWKSVAGNLPSDAPVKVVREDPFNPDLLYAGTETGLFTSLDAGATWWKLGDLPTVAVDDILVHPRDRDLVVATHGRSVYVIDDVRPLEELTPAVLAKPIHVFPPRETRGAYLLPGWEDSNGKAVFRGENPPEGALISFWVKEPNAEPVKISIANEDGQPVASFKVPAVPGIGRVAWNLRPTKEFFNEYGGLGKDKLVRSGTYTVTVSLDKAKAKEKLVVKVAEGVETR